MREEGDIARKRYIQRDEGHESQRERRGVQRRKTKANAYQLERSILRLLIFSCESSSIILVGDEKGETKKEKGRAKWLGLNI